jgi:hypothetical protein
MKKRVQGKQRKEVIDNIIYSRLIYEIAFGNNYAQKIYDHYKTISNVKSASVVSRQLDILEKEEHFVTSKTIEDKSSFPMKKLRIYSIDWSQIIEAFMKKLKWHKDTILEQAKALNTNYEQNYSKQIVYFKFLEDKQFLDMLKRNTYLQKYLEVYFSQMPTINMNYTISELLGYIVLVGNFNFVTSGRMNISQIVTYLHRKEQGLYPSNVEGKSEEEWKKIDTKRFEKELASFSKKIIDNTQKDYETIDLKIKDITEKDLQLKQLTILQVIFSALQIEVTLQVPLNNAIKETSEFIAEKVFSEEEKKNFRDFNFHELKPKQKEEVTSSKPSSEVENKDS